MSSPKSADTTSGPLSQPPSRIPNSSPDNADSRRLPTDQSTLPSMLPVSTAAVHPAGQSPTSYSKPQAKGTDETTTNPRSKNMESLDELGRMVDFSPSRKLVVHNDVAEPHHLHIFSTKHNTHITLTNPHRQPIISVSSGTIGFRKAARGSYDAAYQLGTYVLGRIQQQGLMTEIQHLEVILRDFGAGREAVTKILLGSEGRNLRGRIIRVCDATRLKFGGTRSKKPRRLG
ncbi:MAG: hypothetical protein LQ352_007430 [Teloschistes flavicans]|nr:MAG: hypothetical protein LQ352_007430 [Teloschistes flavicans]